MKKPRYIIGIDWGRKRCGIALADTETLIASGYGECDVKELVARINQIGNDVEIQEIVLGFSRLISNEKQNRLINDVAGQLKRSGYPVELEEEIYSTKMAQQHLQEAKKNKVSKQDNVESARIILQSWIDKNM